MTLSVTFNGTTYSDNGAVGKGMSKGRWRDNWFPMLQDAMTDFSGKLDATSALLLLAQKAADSAAMAASTVVTGPGSNGTSATALTVSLGVQNLVVQPGKTLPVGAPIGIAMTAAPRNCMYGTVDSYNSATGALQARVKYLELETPGVLPQGSAWTVFLCGTAGITGVLNELKGDAIATASVLDLNAATGNYLHLTGSATVTTVALAQGAGREVTLDGNPTFVHSANLLIPTGANIAGAPGDVLRFRGEGGNVVKIVSWVRASGKPLVSAGFVEMTASGIFTPVPGASYYLLDGVGGGASGQVSIGGYAGGGGAGERIQRIFPASAITGPLTVLVGSGGQPVTVSSVSALGNNGGDTSFGNLLVAHGGKAGVSLGYGGNGGGIVVAGNQLATGQLGGYGSYYSSPAEWGGGSGGGCNTTSDTYPSAGGGSINGPAGGGAVSAMSSVPTGKPGGKSGTYSSGDGGIAGTSTSRNGGAGKDATSWATCGDGGGASYYTGANNIGGDGGWPGGGGGGAVSSSGTATSGAGKPGVARIYWW